MNKNDIKYRSANCCNNCEHIFKKEDYDFSTEYYCTFSSCPRPDCGSIFMNEEFDNGSVGAVDEIAIRKNINSWKEWKRDKVVRKTGVCDNYIREEI